MIISGERQISYPDIQTRIARAASGFLHPRPRVGAPVAMMLRNDFALFEVSRRRGTGSPVVPINWHLKAEEVAYILAADSGADILARHTPTCCRRSKAAC